MKLNTNPKSLAKVQAHLVAECFNKLFIGGQFVDPIDGEKLPTYYPATGELLHEFPRGKANDVEAAIAAAEAVWAEGTWAGMAAAERTEIGWRKVSRTTSRCSPRSRPQMSASPTAKRP